MPNITNDTDWTVLVNGVQVGSLSDQVYRAIKTRARRDPSNALAQAVNVAQVLARFVGLLLRGFPMFAFWLAMLMVLLTPDVFAEMLRSASRTDATSVTNSVQ